MNARHSFRETFLYLSAFHGYSESVRLLLSQNDVDVNASDREDRTPLHAVVWRKSIACVKLLLSHKDIRADIHAQNSAIPLILAEDSCHSDADEIRNLLRQHYYKYQVSYMQLFCFSFLSSLICLWI